MRRCTVCARNDRDRRMKDHLRHLHELPAGTPFRLGDRVSRLVEVHQGRAVIEEPAGEEEVSFETRGGSRVTFTRSTPDTRPCSPTAQVVPLENGSRPRE